MTPRLIPSPAFASALIAYGRAFCRAAHLDTRARRDALDAAEQALLHVIEAGETEREPEPDDDTGPRQHIPRDLLAGY